MYFCGLVALESLTGREASTAASSLLPTNQRTPREYVVASLPTRLSRSPWSFSVLQSAPRIVLRTPSLATRKTALDCTWRFSSVLSCGHCPSRSLISDDVARASWSFAQKWRMCYRSAVLLICKHGAGCQTLQCDFAVANLEFIECSENLQCLRNCALFFNVKWVNPNT